MLVLGFQRGASTFAKKVREKREKREKPSSFPLAPEYDCLVPH
jgi:hypothetical protein